MTVHTRRVRVSQIHPAETRLEDLAGRSAFLGVSLSNPIMTGSAVQSLLDWAGFNFQPLRILVGDYIERHNLVFETGGDLARAGELAMSKAVPVTTTIDRALHRGPKRDIEVITSKEIILSPRFGEIFPILEKHFEQEAAFRTVILDDISTYIERVEKRQRALAARDEVVRHSVRYVLEELAVFSILMERGLSVQLYPGRHLKILVELANKRLKSPVFGLNELICIDLSVSH